MRKEIDKKHKIELGEYPVDTMISPKFITQISYIPQSKEWGESKDFHATIQETNKLNYLLNTQNIKLPHSKPNILFFRQDIQPTHLRPRILWYNLKGAIVGLNFLT